MMEIQSKFQEYFGDTGEKLLGELKKFLDQFCKNFESNFNVGKI